MEKKESAYTGMTGLACFENSSGPEMERIRKAFIKLFKNEFSFNIVSDASIKVVNFLDLTLNLSTGKYEPYNKPDNKPLYINVKSNHPPKIIKNLPESISRRINKLSSDKTVFNNSKELFNNALFNSGFDHKIKFQPLTENKDLSRDKNRGRKIVWFNPPYSCIVATKIGKKFLLLLDKHFPKPHKLSKVFNRNNVKVSYSSMPNFASIINSHNKKILNENIAKPTSASCNCRVKASCPLDGNCLQSSLVYICKAATPKITNNYPHYIGLTDNTFKDRLYKHKNSFKYESKKNATELSNFVWENKHENTETSLEWKILDKARSYEPGSRKCMLCLTEKYHIVFSKLNLLNSRSELVTKCRHENKFYLSNYKDIPP